MSGGRRRAVMVDIDGTICLKGDRDPYDLTRVGEDLPNAPVVTIVQTMRAAGYDLVLCSGREEVSRRQTESWLLHHLGDFEALFMRAAKDYRPDHEVKVELYRRFIEPRWDVLAVFDDRASVCKAWREECGLTVCQVAEGAF